MALDPITAALDIGDKLIGHFFPDKAQQDQAKLQLLTLAQNGELQKITGQLQVNSDEAKSNSIFVAGWRPYIGWICGSALGFQFIARPLITWICALAGHPVAPPSLDMADLFTLLFGMLGLGAMRSYDKTQGTSNGQ